MAGMRLKDYIAQLTKEDCEEIFANIDEEEQELREFLSNFEEEQLGLIAVVLNDAFQLPNDGMNVVDFLVELYKCQKADFYFDSVEDAIEQINIIKEDLDFDIGPSGSSVIYL